MGTARRMMVLFVCATAVASCSPERKPEPDILDFVTCQWFIEACGPSGMTEFGEFRGPNLLVDSERANDPDVLDALECALRYGLTGAPPDSLCFVGFGWDEQGRWLDPPVRLLGRLADLPVRLAPVSQAGLNPVPPSSDRGFASVFQPLVRGARCTLELREWSPGLEAEIRFVVFAPKRAPKGGGAATALLGKADGVWSVREWNGERAWSAN